MSAGGESPLFGLRAWKLQVLSANEAFRQRVRQLQEEKAAQGTAQCKV